MREKPFSICHLNVRSLLPKIENLRDIVHTKNYSIVTISETHLNPNISSNDVSIDGYNLIRVDRRGICGGLAMYLHKSLKYKIIPTSSAIEQLWVSLFIFNKKFSIGTVYRPQKNGENYTNNKYKDFLSVLEKTIEKNILETDTLLCLGDFNMDQLEADKPDTRHLNDILNNLSLTQIIEAPTRITRDTATLIDLILTSDESMITEKGVVDMHNLSDHDLIYCKFKQMHDTSPKKIKYRDFKNFNYDFFEQDLHHLPIFHVTELDNVNDKIEFFNSCLIFIFQSKNAIIF